MLGAGAQAVPSQRKVRVVGSAPLALDWPVPTATALLAEVAATPSGRSSSAGLGLGYLAPAGAVPVQDQGLVHALPSAAPGSATAGIGKTGSMPAALPADLHAVCYTAPRTA